MGEIIKDGNVDREVVKVACPVVEGNDQGFYITYRDAMQEGDVEFGAQVTAEPVARPARPARSK